MRFAEESKGKLFSIEIHFNFSVQDFANFIVRNSNEPFGIFQWWLVEWFEWFFRNWSVPQISYIKRGIIDNNFQGKFLADVEVHPTPQ